ncbi:SAC3 family protein C isoform X2 [Malania oleifera]|nr:SAC3 family protein C isoform X2 [Malania oleifera]
MESWTRRSRGSSPSSSSSHSSQSFTHSSRFRSHKFPSKSTRNADSRLSNPKHNPAAGTGDDSDDAHHLQSTSSQVVELDEHNSSCLPSLVGTCPFMCPDGERMQREQLRDLAVFERLNGNPRKSSTSLAVKKFCRTISMKSMNPSDVRPLQVLEDTLNYLLNLLDSTEHPFEVVHDFIFDRTRSIRQDLSMQNIMNDRAIHMYEDMVKFHIISLHKLQGCDGSPNASMHYLNMEQLTKALVSLYNLYEANRNSSSIYENEAEFRSFYVLHHLGSNSQPTGESLSFWLCNVPSSIIKSKEMSFARRVLRFYRMGNYKRFICTVAVSSSYLQYCIIEPYINEIRALALLCVNHGGYKLHPYPLVQLSKLLMMKESDVESLCNVCGLETSTDEVGNKFLPAKQMSFRHPRALKNYPLLGLECLQR